MNGSTPEKRRRAAVECLLLLAAFLLVLAIVRGRPGITSRLPSTSTDDTAAGQSYTQPSHSSNALPDYEIVDRDVYDAPVKTQITLRVVAYGKLTEAGLRGLLDKLYQEVSSETGFQYGDGTPTHIFIYVYKSEGDVSSGYGWVAMLSRIGENAPVETDIRNELLTAKPEVREGLSEDQRKRIFYEIAEADDRARSEADERYPIPSVTDPSYSDELVLKQVGRQNELAASLRKKYEGAVAEKHKLTREQLNKIKIEGVRKRWPMPPL